MRSSLHPPVGMGALGAEESLCAVEQCVERKPRAVEQERSDEDHADPQDKVECHATAIRLPESTTDVHGIRLYLFLARWFNK